MCNLNICVDMFGCPNKCKHCWIGHMPNKNMQEGIDVEIVEYFRPFFDAITFYSWLREPDYTNDYVKRWNDDNELSKIKPKRFELASFYRLVRDYKYVEFLKKNHVKTVQLTFFGLEKNTDFYIGRKGAFKELIKATDILLNNGIAPRYQVFINRENKNDIVELLALTKSMKLMERCKNISMEFEFFIHSGSSDGENFKLVDKRINKDEIPLKLIPYYWNYDETFTESELVLKHMNNDSYINFDRTGNLTLYISNTLDVFFNYTEMTLKWKIGNLKTDNKTELIRRIKTQDVEAINIAKITSISYLIKTYGDKSSRKIFFESDYLEYLLHKHLESFN